MNVLTSKVLLAGLQRSGRALAAMMYKRYSIVLLERSFEVSNETPSRVHDALRRDLPPHTLLHMFAHRVCPFWAAG